MRVLVTDGTMKKSLAVVRAISDVATEIGVSSAYRVSTASLSRYTDRHFHIRDRSPEAIVESYNRIAADHGYDYLLPVGGRTFEIVSAHRDELEYPIDCILPSHEALMTAIHKSATYDLAAAEGVPVPDTWVVGDRRELERIGREISYPAVIKTGIETEPRFVRIVSSATELGRAYDIYEESHESDPIVQEYLPGASRGFFCLFLEGELHGGYAHRRIREFPPTGGASACAQSEVDEELRAHTEQLLSPLEWHGVAMVEFKESDEGVPHVIEINPKFWGSLDLGVASGMNFPAALLAWAAEEDHLEFGFHPSRVHWPLSGDLMHAFRRPRSAPAVFWDLLSRETRSNIRIDDPIPHVLEGMVNAVSSAKQLN